VVALDVVVAVTLDVVVAVTLDVVVALALDAVVVTVSPSKTSAPMLPESATVPLPVVEVPVDSVALEVASDSGTLDVTSPTSSNKLLEVVVVAFVSTSASELPHAARETISTPITIRRIAIPFPMFILL